MISGRTHVLTRETIIARPLDELFAFFADAANLEKMTPPELHFEMAEPKPTTMVEGTLIDYRLGLFGARFGWRTLISVWDPPHSFTDLQLAGPYRKWEHTHTFESMKGGTRVADRVLYELPLHPLSLPALPLVRWQLDRIFDYRASVLIDIFR